MCGRFALAIPPEVLAAFFQLESVPASLTPRYNVAPGQRLYAVRLTRQGARRLSPLRWGLIPHWVKRIDADARMINARRETLEQKPAFRDAFQRRRCLVPATGFFEWGPREGGGRQPFFVRHRDGSPLALAGLWERWRAPTAAPEDKAVDSCTIITTPAEGALAAVHDRAPAVVRRDAWSAWLDRDVHDRDALQAMLAHPDELEIVAVDTRVNDPAVDDEACITPLSRRD